MKINSQNYSFNFKGIKIAKATIKNTNEPLEFDVYKITPKDKIFLSNLYQSTDVCKLYPGLQEYHYHLWDHVLKESIKMDDNEKIFLLAKDKKPCGLLNYSEEKSRIFVNSVCTIPLGKFNKVPWVGTTLFLSLFKEFLKTPLNRIRLVAAKSAPFPTVPKYYRLGFKSLGGDEYNEVMVIDKNNVQCILQKNENNIEFIEINNNKDIDLEKHLKLP